MGYSKAQKLEAEKKRAERAAAKSKAAASAALASAEDGAPPAGSRKRGAAAAEAANPPAAEAPPPQRAKEMDDDFNADYYKNVQNAIHKITSCELFQNVRTDDPLPLDPSLDELDRGDLSTFCVESFNGIMGGDSKGSYRAGCNIFWMDMFRSVAIGVPYNPGQVQRLKTHFFKETDMNTCGLSVF